MPDNVRWIAVLVVAVAILGGIVLLRRQHVSEPEPEPGTVVGARRPTLRAKPRLPPKMAGGPQAPSSESLVEPQHREAPALERLEPRTRGGATPGVETRDPAATKAGGQAAEAPDAIPADQPTAGPDESAAAQSPALSVSFDGSATATDQTAPIIAEGVEFDPRVGAARFPPTASLAYPESGGINLEEGTIAFWLRTEWDPRDPDVPVEGKTLVELRPGTWENRLDVHMGPRFVSFLLTTSDGIEHGVGSAIGWAPDEWHHVTATWGEALMSLYIDARVRDERTYGGTLEIPLDTPLYVASTRVPAEGQGTVWMRGFQVFVRAFSPAEVTALAAQTSPPQ